jgi:rubrerythrin
MNIFEFAMKMEEDGRAYYLEHAKKAENPSLKRILLEMADDELKHYRIFKAMSREEKIEYIDSEKTRILDTVKTVFQTLKENDQEYSFTPNTKKIWEVALDVEKKAENFYREKAKEVNDDNGKRILNKIADEEHRHWITLDSVIQFLDQPKRWLEDAEWNNLEPY